MSLYLALSDFKAQSKIAKDIFTTSDLQPYLDKFEVRYLQELLGADLYAAFKVDFAIIGTAPTDAKFIEIWDAFAMDDELHIHRSEGIKEMLVMFIYFEYLRDQFAKNNIAGMQKNEQANATHLDSQGTNVYTLYNEALETYCAIQWLIWDNPNNYDWDEYNGQIKDLISIV